MTKFMLENTHQKRIDSKTLFVKKLITKLANPTFELSFEKVCNFMERDHLRNVNPACTCPFIA